MRLNPEIFAFSIGALAQNFVVGATVVALAWTTLEISGSYESVGIVFLVGNLTNLLVGPFIGALVDRCDRRAAFLCGAGISAAALALPVVLDTVGRSSQTALFVVAFLCSLGGGAQGPSLESLLQRISRAQDLPQIAAVRNLLRQLGLVGGAGVSGVLLATSGPYLVFSIAVVLSLVGGAVVRFGLPSHRPVGRARQAYLSSFFEGIGLLRRRDIALTGAVIVASWSAGQIVNATLAGLVRQQGLDSVVYGIGDALWSVGAFATALWLARRLGRARLSAATSVVGIGGLGIAMTGLSFATQSAEIFVACAMLGAFFSVAKVISDARFIVICEQDIIGRVRSNLSAISGGVGVLVYLAPSLFGFPPSAMILASGGLLLALFAALRIATR